jgi:hypothetical protein
MQFSLRRGLIWTLHRAKQQGPREDFTGGSSGKKKQLQAPPCYLTLVIFDLIDPTIGLFAHLCACLHLASNIARSTSISDPNRDCCVALLRNHRGIAVLRTEMRCPREGFPGPTPGFSEKLQCSG